MIVCIIRVFANRLCIIYKVRMTCFDLETDFALTYFIINISRPGQHVHVLFSLMNLILLLQQGEPLGILVVLWTEWFLR